MEKAQYTKTLEINAPAESVYKAFVTPSDLRLWRHVLAQYALRPSGHFTLADPEGDVFESGEFLEVQENKLLTFRMEHHGFYKGSEVTVAFQNTGESKTQLSFTHANLSKSDLPHASASWDWALQNLKSYVEEGKTQTFNAWFKIHKQNYSL